MKICCGIVTKITDQLRYHHKADENTQSGDSSVTAGTSNTWDSPIVFPHQKKLKEYAQAPATDSTTAVEGESSRGTQGYPVRDRWPQFS